MERKGFVFYSSFYEALKCLNKDDFHEVFTAICEYALCGNQVNLQGVSKAIFELIKPQIDANNVRYTNGCKGAEFGKLGGRPKGRTKKIKNPEKTPKKPQENPNGTPKEKEKDKDNYLSTTTSIAREENFCEQLKNEQVWIETACMQLHFTPDELKGKIDAFEQHLTLSGSRPRDFKDYKAHCINWLRVMKEKENSKNQQNGTNRNNNRKSNERPDGWLDAVAAIVDNVATTERMLQSGDSQQ